MSGDERGGERSEEIEGKEQKAQLNTSVNQVLSDTVVLRSMISLLARCVLRKSPQNPHTNPPTSPLLPFLFSLFYPLSCLYHCFYLSFL